MLALLQYSALYMFRELNAVGEKLFREKIFNFFTLLGASFRFFPSDSHYVPDASSVLSGLVSILMMMRFGLIRLLCNQSNEEGEWRMVVPG